MLATVVANRGSAKEIIEFREKVMFGATTHRCVSECVAFIYSTTVSYENKSTGSRHSSKNRISIKQARSSEVSPVFGWQ